MQKKYTSLGLMSGTSGDGVDASIICSDGKNEIQVLKERYYDYDDDIYRKIHSLKEKIFKPNDLKIYSKEILELERKITIFHAKIISEFEIDYNDFIVGFHGQTIYHNPKEKISNQLGDGNLLHQLTNKKIIFNFRKNDILNGGEGAPLTPIFHQLIATQKKFDLPVCILNIGGISNITIIKEPLGSNNLFSKDLGPGNCLIDTWVRKNSNYKFDIDGKLAASGKTNEVILEQAQNLFTNRIDKNQISFDINDFDISFIRGLNLEDGAATLTTFTANIISEELILLQQNIQKKFSRILICGGGRKNKVLLDRIKKNLISDIKIQLIDDYNINGDFVESQAFAYLAIRSILSLPISFPSTTGCEIPSIGGEIIEN